MHARQSAKRYIYAITNNDGSMPINGWNDEVEGFTATRRNARRLKNLLTEFADKKSLPLRIKKVSLINAKVVR